MIKELQGPVLVLGAGGFIGSAIFKELSTTRTDVVGTISNNYSWRLGKNKSLIKLDLLKEIEWLLLSVDPKTIINCAAYGQFPSETIPNKIYKTNFALVSRILHNMQKDCAYVHAGTSSEYGFNSWRPKEHERLTPNSNYAVSKAAASDLIEYFGKFNSSKCCNLRLYSVYGPGEAYSRLMPQLVAFGHKKQLPQLVSPNISRDFVYIDDVVKAFITMATELHYNAEIRGEAYNICTGDCTYIFDLAQISKAVFGIEDTPDYSMPPRPWDGYWHDWVGCSEKVSEFWRADVAVKEGILKLSEWLGALDTEQRYQYELQTAK